MLDLRTVKQTDKTVKKMSKECNNRIIMSTNDTNRKTKRSTTDIYATKQRQTKQQALISPPQSQTGPTKHNSIKQEHI